jgi:hypothetical protein
MNNKERLLIIKYLLITILIFFILVLLLMDRINENKVKKELCREYGFIGKKNLFFDNKGEYCQDIFRVSKEEIVCTGFYPFKKIECHLEGDKEVVSILEKK